MEPNDSVDIVVDTRDADVVARLLSAADASFQPLDSNARLGLLRWQVHRPRDVALALNPSATDAGDEVGLLVSALSQAASRDHDGWQPIVEPDVDDEVMTNPHVKIALGDPEPYPAPDRDPAPPPAAAGPRVGVADAQVYAHDALAGHFLGRPVTGFGPFPTAGPGHATFVAGTVLNRAPTAHLVCLPVLEHGQRNTSWQVATKLMGFLDQQVDILNMSFGCLVVTQPSLAMRRAIERLSARIVLVAAIGNFDPVSPAQPMYPAAFADVVGVGAGDRNGELASFTPNVPWLNLLAPGVDVVGPFLPGPVTLDSEKVVRFDSGYALWNGSSFASAAVSGAIARRMQEHNVDAFTARDEILADGDGDIVPFAFDPSAAADPSRPRAGVAVGT